MTTYLGFVEGGQWVVSRPIAPGRAVELYQDRKLNTPADAKETLIALGLEPSDANLDLYFPVRGTKGRCATLELLELFCAKLGNKLGEAKQSI